MAAFACAPGGIEVNFDGVTGVVEQVLSRFESNTLPDLNNPIYSNYQSSRSIRDYR